MNNPPCRRRPIIRRTVLIGLIVASAMTTGCRAIRRFGESRQAIAARRLSGQGFEAMHDGNWQDAETMFADALDVSQSDDRAHWGMAEANWQRGQTDAAIEHMRQAVRLSAGDPKLVRRLGRMYFDVGELELADEHAVWALQTARDSAESWALRGDCLHATGNATEALAAYHRALAYQPDYPDVQTHTAEIYYQDQRLDRCLAAIDRLHDAVGLDAATSDVDMLQGLALAQLGRHDEARRCFVRASGKSPEDVDPHLQLAMLDSQFGRTEQAAQSLQTALRLDPMCVPVDNPLRALLPGEDRTRLAREEPLGLPY